MFWQLGKNDRTQLRWTSVQQISERDYHSMHGELALLIGFCFVTADRQQMQALVCLAELEGLHIQQSASTFDKCNKEGLVRGLWRNHKHERKVRVIEDYFFSCFVVVVVFLFVCLFFWNILVSDRRISQRR